MLDYSAFKNWLVTSSDYSKKTVSNIISRLKRADAILSWYDDEVYLFHLEQAEEYGMLSSPVRSQIKKAVKLYSDYLRFETGEDNIPYSSACSK